MKGGPTTITLSKTRVLLVRKKRKRKGFVDTSKGYIVLHDCSIIGLCRNGDDDDDDKS